MKVIDQLTRLATILLSLASLAQGYLNPIVPGMNPDPSILRDGDDYWLIVTSLEFTPGIPIYHSRDLIDWKLHSHALTRPSQLTLFGTPSSLGIWASTIRKHKSRYYISSASYENIQPNVWPKGFYVWTDDIKSGRWSDPVYFNTPGFDQDLFFDDENGGNKVYLGYTRRGYANDLVRCWTTEIDLKSGNSLTHPQQLVDVTVLWPEGSHVYKINGTYQLITAAGGTQGNGHRVMSYRSSVSPTGPWEANPRNPVLQATSGSALTRTGHADIVEGKDGRWWSVFLGVREINGVAQLGREVSLVPVTWKDGWPVFNDGNPASLVQEGLYNISHPTSWKDDFNSQGYGKKKDELGIGWYQVRTPYKKDHSLSERKGYLRIWGNAYNLTDRATPSIYVRKQLSFSTVWSTSLEFFPRENSTVEAGVALWLSETSHQTIGLAKCADGSGDRCVVARAFTGPNNTQETKEIKIGDEGAVQLMIQALPTYYTLQYSLDNGETVKDMVSFNNTLVRVAETGFSGSFFGLYSTGRGFPAQDPADFAYARWDNM